MKNNALDLLNAGEYFRFLSRFGSSDILKAFTEFIAHRVSGQQYWKLLRIVWQMSVPLRKSDTQTWHTLLNSKTAGRMYFMTPREKAVLRDVSDKLNVYRGQNDECDKTGLSWRLKRSMAIFSSNSKNSYVGGTVFKHDVFALLISNAFMGRALPNVRSEGGEIIVRNNQDVLDVKVMTIDDEDCYK